MRKKLNEIKEWIYQDEEKNIQNTLFCIFVLIVSAYIIVNELNRFAG